MKLCDKCIRAEDDCTEQERITCILDEVRYRFSDGMDIPNMTRDFSEREYAIINGVIDEIERKVGVYYEGGR